MNPWVPFWIFLLAVILPCLSEGSCAATGKMGWAVSEEIFYWIGYEGGLGYTNKPANILTTDDFTRSGAIVPSFEWDWGFRLGASYAQCDTPWSYAVYWTYLQSKAHGHRSVNSGAPDFQGTYPIWSMGPDTLAGDYVASSTVGWHLYGDLLDFVFQYACPRVGDRFVFSTLFGLRGALLSQKLTAKYAGGTFFSGVDQNALKDRYLGGGPRAGFWMDTDLGLGFSFIARAAIAPLFGYFRIAQREMYLDSERLRRSRAVHHVVLSTDYEAGFRWRGLILENKPYITVGLAWELQEFFYANQLYRGPYHFFSKNRHLFLQGVTGSAALDF